MQLNRRRALALSGAFAAGLACPAFAQQNWPQRALRILIGTSPGGSPDIVGRLLADKLAERLGQSVTVENNTGGGGGIAASIVSHAPPDGYSMTLLTAGYASGAAVGKFPFDGDDTFGFLSMVCAYPFVYQVPKDSPIKSFPDLLERAKANPGKIRFGGSQSKDVDQTLVRRIEAASVGLTVPDDPSCKRIREVLTEKLGALSQEQRARSRAFDQEEMSDGGNVHRLILALVNGP
mgnify:CR=1 FL=1